MEEDIEIAAEGDILVIRVAHESRLDDWAAIMRSAAEQADTHGSRALLIDDLGSDFSPAASEIDAIAELIDSLWAPRVKRLALVVRKDVQFGAARMVAAALDESRLSFHVFRELTAARTWLG